MLHRFSVDLHEKFDRSIFLLKKLKQWNVWDFPRASQVALVVKSPPDPWVRKIPWRREWQPTPLCFPGESHGQRSLEGYSPQSHKNTRLKQFSTHSRMGLPWQCSSQGSGLSLQGAWVQCLRSQILHYMEKKLKNQCTMISIIVVQLYLNRIGGTEKMV